MAYESYACLKVRVDRGVAFVSIDHPPINLMDLAMIEELTRLRGDLENDPGVRVAVFQSANPEFFIAHVDTAYIPKPQGVPPKSNILNPFHQMVEQYRTMPKATIGKVEGRARGGGSEFLLSLDMRFGAIGRAVFNQPEVAFGIIPGGGGTQRLPRLIGRSRALEVILGCHDFPAELAERYGYINRALPPEELTPFVEELAYRIASFPAEAIALAKAAVDASELPVLQGLIEEAHYFNQSAVTKEAQERMVWFMGIGGQTKEAELELDQVIEKLVARKM